MSERISHFRLAPYHLPLIHPWRFHGHCVRQRDGWLIRLEDAQGLAAWGEAAPLPALGTEDLQACRTWLEARGPVLVGACPQRALADLPPADDRHPAARCGLETALLDLQARQSGLPLARRLNPQAPERLQVNAVAGALHQVSASELDDLRNAGYQRIKIKLGLQEPAKELPLLLKLLEQLPEGLQLRLDANRAWRPAEAQRLIRSLEGQPVELLEEPLRPECLDSMAELRSSSTIPLALDESLCNAGLGPLLARRPMDILVLKPMRLGGLQRCLEIARKAHARGLACLVTTSLDGAIAGRAACHLAAAMDGISPSDNLAHGLATAGFLARDLTSPLAIDRGAIHLPAEPGLGLFEEPTP